MPQRFPQTFDLRASDRFELSINMRNPLAMVHEIAKIDTNQSANYFEDSQTFHCGEQRHHQSLKVQLPSPVHAASCTIVSQSCACHCPELDQMESIYPHMEVKDLAATQLTKLMPGFQSRSKHMQT